MGGRPEIEKDIGGAFSLKPTEMVPDLAILASVSDEPVPAVLPSTGTTRKITRHTAK